MEYFRTSWHALHVGLWWHLICGANSEGTHIQAQTECRFAFIWSTTWSLPTHLYAHCANFGLHGSLARPSSLGRYAPACTSPVQKIEPDDKEGTATQNYRDACLQGSPCRVEACWSCSHCASSPRGQCSHKFRPVHPVHLLCTHKSLMGSRTVASEWLI